MTNQIITLVENALPAMSGSQVTYNKEHNIFLSNGYTSCAGNTYFQGLRLSNRIIINYDFGQGYAHLFLNGIRIYGFDGHQKRLIASRSFYSYFFSEHNARVECEQMIQNYLNAEMKCLNCYVPKEEINSFSKQLVGDAISNNPQRLLS